MAQEILGFNERLGRIDEVAMVVVHEVSVTPLMGWFNRVTGTRA